MSTKLICSNCSQTWPGTQPRWRCDCGGYLDLETEKMFARSSLVGRASTLWRYAESLGIEDPRNQVSFGEGLTPLTPCLLEGREVLLKLDYLRPTGSFKDRGTAVMMSKLKEWGISQIVDDSSGNAGASVAAYAAAAGIHADVYIPAYASVGKATQIRAYGATLIKILGSREDTTAAALAAAAHSFYSSHIWSPYFVAGMKTIAHEIAEQLDWKAPDWVVVPVGGGTMIIGLWMGFQELLAKGYVTRMPRLVAVQSENCAPIYEAWKAGRESVGAIQKRPTAAEGITIPDPVRGKQILRALRDSDGMADAVSDEAIWSSVELMASKGVYIEPTSATAVAGYNTLKASGAVGSRDVVLIPLTGFGLKATDKLVEHYGSP
jgi:threonine synthase